ncbi:MAG: HAMP domain-containing protein, partial [Deltaproteobacteria bacterium]|nr:HAMP domain-containing protein [Deltaproteobacteria bacterium]
PAKEGESILEAKDPTGFKYLKEIARRAPLLKENEVGTIRYPWANVELGERTPRMKINKYQYFRPWDWIIIAGSYEEEIFAGVSRTLYFVILIALGSIALAILLMVILSRVLTRPITELTEITARMAGGNLTQKVGLTSEDEIGRLAQSFNRMADQILNHTRNLEEIVRTRTEEIQEKEEK